MPVLPVVLYGCDTWSLTLREEHRLGMYDEGFWGGDSVKLRGKKGEDWEKLHNEKFII